MAISVDWGTKIITVPQADLTFLGGTLYELETNAFRLTVLALQASEAGAPYPDIFSHNTTVLLAGIQYARIIEIINGYTVTFEDGQYAVNLVGSNNNIADVVNINQVSVRLNNSAGLIQTREIQYASYGDAITIDQLNGSSGTIYPAGTFQQPVDNLADALFIQNLRGLPKRLNVIGDLDAGAGDALTGWHIHGVTTENHFHLDAGSVFTDCEYGDAHLHGVTFGISRMHGMTLEDVTGLNGLIHSCTLTGTLTMAAAGTLALHESFSGLSGNTTPIIDCGGATVDINVRGYNGGIQLNNITSGNASVDMNSGHIVLDSTCTGGTIVVRGTGKLTNNSVGASVLAEGLSSQDININRIATEAIRDTHQGFGNVYVVDPTNGLDTNDGRTPGSALATFAQAHSLCVDGANDVIQFINPSSAGVVHSEDILITKANVHLRATSRDITFKGVASGGSVITVGSPNGSSGYNCSISGLLVDGDKDGSPTSDYGITVYGKFCALNFVWVKQSVLDCICFRGGDYHTISGGEIEKAGRHGVSTFDDNLVSGNPREISILGRTNIYLNAGNGVHIGTRAGSPALGTTTRIIRLLDNTNIHNNTGHGLHAEPEVQNLLIGTSIMIHHNNGGHMMPQTNILTTSYHDESAEQTEGIASEVWDTLIANHTDTTTFGGWMQSKLLTVAKYLALK